MGFNWEIVKNSNNKVINMFIIDEAYFKQEILTALNSEFLDDNTSDILFDIFKSMLNYAFPDGLDSRVGKMKIIISSDKPNRTTSTKTSKVLITEIDSINKELNDSIDEQKKNELLETRALLINNLKRVLLLGKYDKGLIYIYINNINDYCNWCIADYSYWHVEDYIAFDKREERKKNKAFNDVLFSTYIHEMMHARFDEPWENGNETSKEVIREIEEPLAEFGMLDFLSTFKRYFWNVEAIKDMVKEKQNFPEICYYGYGYYLFSLLENATGDKEKESLQDLYLKYKTGKGNVQEAKEFFKNGYPSKESEYLDYLKSIYK